MTGLRFLPQAEEELLHEVEYYGSSGRGNGIRFQAAVEAALERVARHPYGGAPTNAGTRSMHCSASPPSSILAATLKITSNYSLQPIYSGLWPAYVAERER